MNKADCFNLGYVAKLHGYKGEVSLFFDTNHPEEYSSINLVYIDLDDILTPFFITQIEMGNKGFAKVKFEGVDTESDAKSILKKGLFLPLEMLPKLTGINFYDFEIIGFKVIDEQYGEVGIVSEVLDYQNNPILQVQNLEKGKEVLLPLNSNLIQKVERDKKQLHIQTVQGLIELYLED